MPNFCTWFSQITGFDAHKWQMEIAANDLCRNQLVRIPTGLGKTEGVLGSWLWNASERERHDWPRRLVWCLPMRVLVEQSANRARAFIQRWAEAAGKSIQPRVHVLMGGEDTDRWYLEPESHAVLVGTQDMLLSRALNRGYASGRARWPREYGLLNQDCLWVMDEVQLMDVGLATSAQLQAFRDQDGSKQLRPCCTWWMSATLQPTWLRSVDTAAVYDEWVQAPIVIAPEDRSGDLWQIPKSLSTETLDKNDTSTFVSRVQDTHTASEETECGRITLVVCNTVERACATYAALRNAECCQELELVHGRFRPADRTSWHERFLSRVTCKSGVDRIIVATQVVEAGVDISASCLITELAPWPSLVQRFGRCARYGGAGRVIVVDRGQDAKSSSPYEPDLLARAWEAVQSLENVNLATLEAFEEGLDDDSRARLYPYQAAHLLMRDEYEELFDTTPDLTGADLDISRFIRSGEERDLLVFWDEISKEERPSNTRQPNRDELCPIPFLTARNWLCGEESKSSKKSKLLDRMRAWVWDWIDGEWITAKREMLVPGQIVCVDANCGGYSILSGFSADSRELVPMVVADANVETNRLELADTQHDGEPLSISEWKTIGFHSSEVEDLVAEISTEIGLSRELVRILTLAAHWHDVGKAHPAFQGKIRGAADEPRPDRNDLAKAPQRAWLKSGEYVFPDEHERRPGFRHELASALALFSVLQLYAPDHPALLGPWQEVLEKMGYPFPAPTATAPSGQIQAVLDCTNEEFDLLAYLVASHHGKVRVALHAAPADQDYKPSPGDSFGLPIRGVRNGDRLPAIILTPNAPPLPELPMTLEPAALGLSFQTGASWRERTQKLIQCHGPAALGFLEAILRAADARASQRMTEDLVFLKETVR